MAHDPIDTLGKATRHNMLVKAECSCGNVRYCRYFFSETDQGIDLLHLVRVTAIGDAFPDRLIAMPLGRLIACTFRRSLAFADR
ncbi:MAG: hypothetical protein E5Y79_16980 [Mesorhizobium sp.]|nr:MAG: hypothetical protein EOS06_05225 [Mesorhizobium sp.]TIL28832.1 MAG: hypothetical protein E5Y85_30730 [Mesorhizobium sp.]TIL49277.1 MAG: hypothetical protein E5Y83_27005 [Mesorhizobium sp.]TIL58906.1 MAG: hypothetical protein E5Y79_16980 [Mesorhizobium sp.]TIL95426.1 MAG: hypothetical protein E5Y73_06475 [Mesorhizobium sp.]